MDMSIKEAASVLSGMVNNLRAATRLERALKTAEAAEQVAKEKIEEKSKLDVEVNKLSSEIEVLEQRVIAGKSRADSVLDDTSRFIQEVKAKASEAQDETDEEIKKLEEKVKQRSKELEAAHDTQVKSLEDKIKSKEEELISTESRLQNTKDKLALIKKGLEEEE